MITRYLLLYKVHKILVLALEEFFVKVDKRNTIYIRSRIKKHVSLRFH